MSDSQEIYNFFNDQYIIDEIVAKLDKSQIFKAAVISGPSGCGKSFLLNEIGLAWQQIQKNNLALRVNCEEGDSQRAYRTLIRAVTEATQFNLENKVAVTGASELAKGIPYAGDFIGFLVKTLGDKKVAKQAYVTRYLNDTEKNLIHDLASLSEEKYVMMIIDDAQWLDYASVEFLKLLFDKEFVNSIPQLTKICFVFSINTSNSSELTSLVIQTFDKIQIIKKDLTYVGPERYQDVLKKFGFEGSLSDKTTRLLYSLTSGHLLLIKRLAEYLNHDGSKGFENLALLQPSNESSRVTLIDTLLSFKLKELGANGETIGKALEYAAIIGYSFTIAELACLSKENEQKLSNIIQDAQELHLAENKLGDNFFAHGIIREFFLSRINLNKSIYYEQFAACLAILRPSDYFTRSNCFFEAGKIEEASILLIQEILKSLRDGLPISSKNENRINSLSESYGGKAYYAAMHRGYECFNSGNYENALSTLETIEDYIPKPLIAEKYYLIALCLLKTMAVKDIERARSYLSEWEGLENEEGELWLRITSSLLTVEANLGNFITAEKLHRKLLMHLNKRKSFDKSAELNLNIIRRKANSFCGNEVSCEWTKKSLLFFSKVNADKKFIYPVQRYYSLTNYAANLLVKGDFDEASNHAAHALGVIKDYTYINFIDPGIPASNYIVSGYLASLVSAKDAVALFESLKLELNEVADTILIKNNHVVMLIENGCIEEAYLELENLLQIVESKNLDSYYFYVLKSNQALLKCFQGDILVAKNIWRDLKNIIPEVPDKAFFRRRHEILEQALEQGNIEDPTFFNKYILQNFPNQLGPQWKFYGRGFLFSDIQFWYES